MRLTTLLMTMCLALAGAACDKDDNKGPGDGGGGWLVTDDGVPVFVPAYADELGEYDISRSGDTVWVVGEHGLVLRTFDRGATWQALELDTTRDLRAVAIADKTVIVAGEQLAMVSTDSGDSWTAIADSDQSWTEVAIDGERATLTARDGSRWSYAGGQLRSLAK